MTDETPKVAPPQGQTLTQEQIRVSAQVGVEMLMSETTVIPTCKMEAGIILRHVLGSVAEGKAMIIPASMFDSAPPPAKDPKAKAPKVSKRRSKRVQSKG